MSSLAVAAPEQTIEIEKGASKTFLLAVKDDKKQPVDLTGSTVYWTAKTAIDGTVIIAKVSTSITQIEILNQTTFKGQAKIYLVPSDTSGSPVPVGNYKWDSWVVLSSGKRYPVIPPSDLKVKPTVTVVP